MANCNDKKKFKTSEASTKSWLRTNGIIDEFLKNEFVTFHCEDWVYQYDFTYDKLKNHFGTKSLKGFGIEDLPAASIAAGAILYYLEIH